MSLGALALRNRVQTNEVDELNTPSGSHLPGGRRDRDAPRGGHGRHTASTAPADPADGGLFILKQCTACPTRCLRALGPTPISPEAR
jgi:hypothetical protein